MPRAPSNLENSPLPDRERDICLRLRQIRIDEGLKVSAFAELLGLPIPRLKSYETARAPIRFKLAMRACAQFGYNQRWLATGHQPYAPDYPFEPLLLDVIPQRALFSAVYDRYLAEPITREIEKVESRCGGPLSTQDKAHIIVPGHPGAIPVDARPETLRQLKIEGLFHNLRIAAHGFSQPAFEFFTRGIEALYEEAKSDPENDTYRQNLESDQQRWIAQKKGEILALFQDSNTTDNNPVIIQDQQLTGPIKTRTSTGNDEASSSIPTIGSRIAAARNSLGLSQSAAAKKWGFSVGSLRDWEQGRSEPRGATRDRLEIILSDIERA